MKKIAVFCLFIFTLACSVDDGVSYNLDILPVESVDIPETFQLGETYPITISFFRPSTCYSFKEFYYRKENNERTVAPITYVFEKNDCITLEDDLVEATFNFIVTSNGSYIFKFWQGDDSQGEPIYLTIEVPVIE